MKKRILFWNPSQIKCQYSDFGDIAMFHVMLDKLKEEDLEIVLYSSDTNYTQNKYGIKAVKFNLRGYFKSLNLIRNSDLIIVGGGDLIQDKSSILVLPYNLSMTIPALFFRRPVAAIGIGVDEKRYISRFGKWLSRMVINRYKLVVLRDPRSEILLKELGITKPSIHLAADIALNLKSCNEERVEEILLKEGVKGEKIVGVFLRDTLHRKNSFLPFGIRKKLGMISKKHYRIIDGVSKIIAESIDHIIEKQGVKVLFLLAFPKGTTVSTYDDVFTEKVISLMRNKDKTKIVEEAYDPEEVKGLIKRMEMVISTPLHPIVVSASANTPILDINYAAKVERFMGLIGQGSCVVQIEDLKPEGIKEKADYIFANRENIKKEIGERFNELKKKSDLNAKLILDMIRNEQKS